jgi:hypothetical protein
MDWTAINCPGCRRLQTMRGTHTCRCGQRFKLPKAGKVSIVPEEDAETLFFRPRRRDLVSLREILDLPRLTAFRPSPSDVLQVPAAWLDG